MLIFIFTVIIETGYFLSNSSFKKWRDEKVDFSQITTACFQTYKFCVFGVFFYINYKELSILKCVKLTTRFYKHHDNLSNTWNWSATINSSNCTAVRCLLHNIWCYLNIKEHIFVWNTG
jgi:hypothetical protein